MRRDKEMRRLANWPRRTMEQGDKLANMGIYPFPELTEEQNDTIFCARLSGFAAFFPAFPTAQFQAESTLQAAEQYLSLKQDTLSSRTKPWFIYSRQPDCPACGSELESTTEGPLHN